MRPRPNFGAGAAAVLWLLFIGVPLYALVIASFRPRTSYLEGGPVSIPHQVTLDNYHTVLTSGFVGYLVNTVLIAVAVVVIVLALAVPVGYAVVRGTGWINSWVFRLFLLGLAIPAQAVIIPVFYMINQMGLYDTLWAVILPTAAFSIPVSVLILAGGMRDISTDLYEAMALDGATPSRTFRTLVIPLSRSSIATVGVFTALQAWNGFLFPLILTQSEGTKVITLGLYLFIAQYGANVPALLAAVLLSALPVFVIYLFGRRALVSGLMGVGGK